MTEVADIRRVALASTIGTTLEWYDFFIFASAAALVFNNLFFPTFDPVAGTIASLASFAVGFVARPVGGAVFGHFGDRIGRKAMLVLSLTMMGGVTFLMGLLPTYQSVGVAAPVLLTVLRFVQGFAVGGEWGGATLMVIEHAPAKRRGFYGSWPQMGIPGALILSTGAMAATTALTNAEQFAAWGWRIPFLLSGILVVVGIVIRRRLAESPSVTRLRAEHRTPSVPIATLLRRHKRSTFLLVASQAVQCAGFYVVAVYSLVYLTQNLHMPRADALRALMIAAACTLVAHPAFGALSDRIGRKKVFMGGMIFLGAFIYPYFLLLGSGHYALVVLAMSVAMAIGEGSVQAAQPSLFAEQYGSGVRYSGVSLAYQLATVTWSGPTPMIAAMLIAWAGGYWPLVAYIIVLAVVSVLAIIPLREAAGIELARLDAEPASPASDAGEARDGAPSGARGTATGDQAA
ncbi:MFS transporter [Chitinasiproducens palmae]|uniref:Metabolite-proton symporter n=1 Tax=Chitinasiproducens palmae TaxID=1770053 RepID=A0A1H2PW47_9BURK|nr:MFS transporter [Chitinasiproducens palmae]SDV51547.1 metabolite-proton symporter [Chitinasiproducens palmae]